MLAAFFKRILAVLLSLTSFIPYYNFGSIGFSDTYDDYIDNINSISIYENTLDTALAQTEVYRIVDEFFAAPLPEGKTEKKAIIIGYDGARADALINLEDACSSAVRTVVNDGGKCVLSYAGGANYPAEITQSTSTEPGWCSILTGVWAKDNGILNNPEKTLDHPTLLMGLVDDGTIDSSAMYTSYDGHFNEAGTTYWSEKQYCEENGLDVTFHYDIYDSLTLNSTLKDIYSKDCSDLIFAIFEQCDHMGHHSGFGVNNKAYGDAFRSADLTAKSVIDAIKSRPTYESEDWLIVITSDHGGINRNHGGSTIQERMTFIACNKSF